MDSYYGKSTGAGALAIWTHHLKNIEFLHYTDSSYSGKAIKVGAGVQGGEAYAAADAAGLAVVGGECPTVGIAGEIFSTAHNMSLHAYAYAHSAPQVAIRKEGDTPR